ncbi:hypothetical protein H0H81_010947 [Sphagnurus paluster]|uniref:Replication protein A 32 kDa subunit n=1 Tax=Sphagnurus paluster TaxID=117069 RepID=A0A9P7K430_9AGAR|nr:hypothetical protein H0H81_010947 [Sphagnurus paluster]
MTVAQVLRASQAHADAEWTIDDTEIGQVTLVGQVVTIQSQSTNCVYWVDDGTGRIEARHWVDSTSEEDSGKWSGIEESMYVRVTGTLKTFGSKRYINATHIRVATDPHEVYFHILEAIYVTLMVDRGLVRRPPFSSLRILKQIQSSSRSNMSIAPGSGGGASAYASPQAGSGVQDQYFHLPPLQQKIVRFISTQPRSEEGIHVSSIARAVTGSIGDAEKINDALDKLMDDGLVYTTIDDSHFNLSA